MMKPVCILLLNLAIFATANAQWNNNPMAGTKFSTVDTLNDVNSIMITDGAGGAIVFMESNALSSVSYNLLLTQRMNANGQVLWGSSNTPKPISILNTNKYLEDAIPDGTGGAYVSWVDYQRGNPNGNIFIQHINSSGNPLWAVDGVQVNASNTRENSSSRLCKDASGGVIITWNEFETLGNITTYGQVFAQRFNSTGAAQWLAGGVQVCTAQGFRGLPGIVSDDNGGAIISFVDTRSSNQSAMGDFDNLDMYAQRLNTSGGLLWTANAMPVSTEPFGQIGTEYLNTTGSVSDGVGGVIIVFDDYTGNNFGPNNLIAQRLNSSGVKQWANAGVTVCNALEAQYLLKLEKDGAGGVVACWDDFRDTLFTEVYAQRINANGTVGWLSNGVRPFQGLAGYDADMCEDGNGNYIFTGIAFDTTANLVKAQKINNAGIPQWGIGNKTISTVPSVYGPLVLKSDTGTAIISWYDYRDTTTNTSDVYAAKVDASGTLVGSGPTAYITNGNGNWNNGATWIGGIMPPANADVIIRHQVTVTANATCKTLKAEQPNGNVTVKTGVNLTVTQ